MGRFRVIWRPWDCQELCSAVIRAINHGAAAEIIRDRMTPHCGKVIIITTTRMP